MIRHPFIAKGKGLTSSQIIKNLVKSKMSDLEDNRTRNFKKEFHNSEQEVGQELILVGDKPKRGPEAAEQVVGRFPEKEQSETTVTDLKTFEFSMNPSNGKSYQKPRTTGK